MLCTFAKSSVESQSISLIFFSQSMWTKLTPRILQAHRCKKKIIKIHAEKFCLVLVNIRRPTISFSCAAGTEILRRLPPFAITSRPVTRSLSNLMLCENIFNVSPLFFCASRFHVRHALCSNRRREAPKVVAASDIALSVTQNESAIRFSKARWKVKSLLPLMLKLLRSSRHVTLSVWIKLKSRATISKLTSGKAIKSSKGSCLLNSTLIK